MIKIVFSTLYGKYVQTIICAQFGMKCAKLSETYANYQIKL